jgi:parallel beta-helix repeat protein
MNKLIKIVSAAIVALMLISVCIASGASSGEMNFSSQTRHVDDDLFDYPEANFTKIQNAINASSEGDTIIVHNGTYYENIILNKSLSLLGKGLPTIDAEVNGSAIEIDAPGCVVRGFRCINSGSKEYPHVYGYAIKVYSTDGNVIQNNICENNYGDGIYLYNSSNNIVSDNICENSHGDYIVSNDGIVLYESSNNTISNNICKRNNEGICLDESSNNTISNNICENNAEHDICLRRSSNNTISNNICKSSRYGIALSTSAGNTISNNVCKSSRYGIALFSSAGNTISNNTLEENVYGIYLSYSEDNRIYSNTFVNNDFDIYNPEKHRTGFTLICFFIVAGALITVVYAFKKHGGNKFSFVYAVLWFLALTAYLVPLTSVSLDYESLLFVLMLTITYPIGLAIGLTALATKWKPVGLTVVAGILMIIGAILMASLGLLFVFLEGFLRVPLEFQSLSLVIGGSRAFIIALFYTVGGAIVARKM